MGAASDQTFEQLKANCEAACSSGVHGQCNMVTYSSEDKSCNLGYYGGLVRSALVDSVLNGDCQSVTGWSVWVLAPADAYTLAGTGAKCNTIYTGQNWANTNGFNPCCREHDGDSLDFSASETHKNFQLPSGKEVKTAGVIQMASCDANDTYVDARDLGRTFTCDQAYNQPADTVSSQDHSDNSIYHSASKCDDSSANQNWAAFYFVAPADIAVVEVINRGDAEDNDGCCGYRLGNHEIYYCTNGATNEDDCDWTLCSTYASDTTNMQVIDHECDASAATGFKLVQPCRATSFPYDSTLHVIEVKAYGYQTFEQLRANCEAACDGWAATNGRGSCNVIMYQDKNRCNLGYHSYNSAEDFIQQVEGGSCSTDSRYDTYVRNALPPTSPSSSPPIGTYAEVGTAANYQCPPANTQHIQAIDAFGASYGAYPEPALANIAAACEAAPTCAGWTVSIGPDHGNVNPVGAAVLISHTGSDWATDVDTCESGKANAFTTYAYARHDGGRRLQETASSFDAPTSHSTALGTS